MKVASGNKSALITFAPWPHKWGTGSHRIRPPRPLEAAGGHSTCEHGTQWNTMKVASGNKSALITCVPWPHKWGGRITWCLSSEAIEGRWRSFNIWKWDLMQHHEGGHRDKKVTNNFGSLTPQMGDRITSDPTSKAIGGHWRPLNSVQIVSTFFTGLYRVLLNMVNMASSWSHQICPLRPLEAVEHLWNKMCKDAGLRNGSFLFTNRSAQAWNCLPIDVREAESVNIFKNMYDDWMFNQIE